jgi:hypothetical protein
VWWVVGTVGWCDAVGAVGGDTREVHLAIGSVEGDHAVGGHGETPPAFVDEVVVPGAERRLSHELVAPVAA